MDCGEGFIDCELRRDIGGVEFVCEHAMKILKVNGVKALCLSCDSMRGEIVTTLRSEAGAWHRLMRIPNG